MCVAPWCVVTGLRGVSSWGVVRGLVGVARAISRDRVCRMLASMWYASHFIPASFHDCCVLGMCCSCLVGVLAGKAIVNRGVEGAAEGLADALCMAWSIHFKSLGTETRTYVQPNCSSLEIGKSSRFLCVSLLLRRVACFCRSRRIWWVAARVTEVVSRRRRRHVCRTWPSWVMSGVVFA